MWKISTPKEIRQTQVLGQTWKILKSKEMCIPVFVSRVDVVLACWTIPLSRKRFAFAFAPLADGDERQEYEDHHRSVRLLAITAMQFRLKPR